MLYMFNLLGGSKYKIYIMTTITNIVMYLHPPSKFKIYNMTASFFVDKLIVWGYR